MNDEELLLAFERRTLDRGGFHHRDHVRVTWLLSRRYSLLETLRKMSEGLRALAEQAGAPGKYHETITRVYTSMIHERLRTQNDMSDFAEFESRSPDLIQWPSDIVSTRYSPERVQSSIARESFVLPDRASAV